MSAISGGTNRTVVVDDLLKGDLPRSQDMCVPLADTLLWATLCEPSGRLAPAAMMRVAEAQRIPANGLRGVCLVDICDCSELGPQDLEHGMMHTQDRVKSVEADQVLLIQHLGDDCLAVLDSPGCALEPAERVLAWEGPAEGGAAGRIYYHPK